MGRDIGGEIAELLAEAEEGGRCLVLRGEGPRASIARSSGGSLPGRWSRLPAGSM